VYGWARVTMCLCVCMIPCNQIDHQACTVLRLELSPFSDCSATCGGSCTRNATCKQLTSRPAADGDNSTGVSPLVLVAMGDDCACATVL
jgi:hypothetical protein